MCDEFTDISSRVQSGTLNGNLMYSCGVTVSGTAESYSRYAIYSPFLRSRLILTVLVMSSMRFLSPHTPVGMVGPALGFSVLVIPGSMGFCRVLTTITIAIGKGDGWHADTIGSPEKVLAATS